jgi:hypothetical protein
MVGAYATTNREMRGGGSPGGGLGGDSSGGGRGWWSQLIGTLHPTGHQHEASRFAGSLPFKHNHSHTTTTPPVWDNTSNKREVPRRQLKVSVLTTIKLANLSYATIAERETTQP